MSLTSSGFPKKCGEMTREGVLMTGEEDRLMAADVMTKDQARRYLHISLATLDRWIDKGLIPVVKLERRVLIRKAALDQVLRDHERTKEATP
jgi:excisionase family DNA binding protein